MVVQCEGFENIVPCAYWCTTAKPTNVRKRHSLSGPLAGSLAFVLILVSYSSNFLIHFPGSHISNQ